MTTITTRSAKGSELSYSEMDDNFKRAVTQKTSAYSCLVSDNRSTIECSHASTAFTITLGDAATMAAADPGDYRVTITNINTAVITVSRAGSDTILDGLASLTSLTLNKGDSVTLEVTSAQDAYKVTSKVNACGAAINESKGADIASATTTDLSGATGNYIDITGTTAITGLGTAPAGTRRTVQFDGILTLTYNASSLILPGAANITTAAGDIAEFVSLGSGNWKCLYYTSSTATPAAGIWRHIETQSASNSSEIDFTSNIDSTYKQYKIIGTNILPATDSVALSLRTSEDGVTFDTGGTDYRYYHSGTDNGGTTHTLNSNASASILAAYPLHNAAGSESHMELRIHNPADTAQRTVMSGWVVIKASASQVAKIDFSCFRNATEAVAGIRIYMGSGNITTGDFSLYGLIDRT